MSSNSQDWYALGQQLRRLLLGQTPPTDPAAIAGSKPILPSYDASSGPSQSRSAGVSGMFNQAARLKPGHLLVVFLGHNACFQVDPDSGEIEYMFTVSHEQSPFLWRVLAANDGSLYCTMSGIRNPLLPARDAQFGLAGAVIRVRHHLAIVEAVATGSVLVDPCGMEILNDGRLLVCDFGGFGATGQIYTVDRITGEIRILAEGGMLRDPVSAHYDSDGTLWVANSYMHYYYPVRGGLLEKDDGEILCITPDGKQTVLVPRQSPANGSMVGIHASDNSDEIIAIKGDWPLMETGAVLRVNKHTGRVETLLSAAPGDPKFYSTHVAISGHILWVGEGYYKQVIGYDLQRNAVVKVLDFSTVMGRYKGVASSFEGIESVSVVPQNIGS